MTMIVTFTIQAKRCVFQAGQIAYFTSQINVKYCTMDGERQGFPITDLFWVFLSAE
jgi:hypothetical protein